MAPSVSDLFRRHAGWLEAGGRSPLYAALMRGAGDDIDAGGAVADLLDGDEHSVDSVPQLRLLAPLHQLVLAGDAPALARFYPSAGGDADPAAAWPTARDVIAEHRDWIRERLPAIVQTNEPGRACALHAGLRRLAADDGRPIRLLELGASAGLNLRFDSYAYRVGGEWLGDPQSKLRFEDPWPQPFGADPVVIERAGCDLNPLDPSDADDRLRLLSYVWPDEPDRIARLRAALDIAGASPTEIERTGAADWLAQRLATTHDSGVLTVVWHSVFWQYLPEAERQRLEAMAPSAGTPGLAWLSMEPWHDPDREIRLVLRAPGEAPARLLAICDDHGPPLRPHEL